MKVDRIHPTKEQLEALKNYPADQAITMVNIIKFRDQTEAGNESGKAAYARYISNVGPLIEKAGAKMIWRGNVAQTVIGDAEGQADVIFLVEYPSVQQFLDMINSPEYQIIGKDRSIALVYGGLIACQS